MGSSGGGGGGGEWELGGERVVEGREQRKEARAMEGAKCVGSALPSPELAQFLVSQLCLPNNHQDPSLWKFLHQALSSALLSPFHVNEGEGRESYNFRKMVSPQLILVFILANQLWRVIPHRWSQPEAYRLYLEILSRYAFSFDGLGTNGYREKIIVSVDSTLQLSQTYGVQVLELGHALVLSFFSILIRLIDSTLCDWGLQMTSADKASEVLRSDDSQNMDVDSKEIQIYKRNDHRDRLRKSNSFLAFEVLGQVLLAMLWHWCAWPEKFNGLLQRMQFLEAHTLASPNLKPTHQLVVKLSASIRGAMDFEYHLNKRQFIGMLIYISSYKPALCCNSESGRFACWVPFDINMEDAMDGKQFPVTSAIDILTETINTLKVFNRASWQETFLALWLSALRLVQRERDPLEGPVPHLEARLCILLSITPLAIARVLEDNATFCSFPGCTASRDMECGCGHGNDDNDHALRKQGLISSLQVLGHFTSLLCPPTSVVNAANIAAAKATSFMFNSKNVKDGITGGGCSDALVKAGGDMRHLIVEACIARKLIDTSAYFWPGYVSALVTSVSEPSPLQKSPCYAEVEKLYYLALNGSEEEKSTAAKILCSASLSRGWNLQEHVVHFVVKLLSPPIPPNFKGSRSHLVEYMSMLSAILFGASSIDTVHILSLHGVVPEVAASLLPLCETFGSLVPTSGHKLSIGDESSIYMVFSSAFLFLLRLWKFYRPPLEQCVTGRGGALRGELTLEYLLLLRNSRIRPPSTLSGLCSGNPVHQVANKILNMICKKMTTSGTMSSDSSMLSSSRVGCPLASTGEDAYQRPVFPAWEVLEAIPYVLEAILTACAHGRISSRDLTTGLRDLVDFLPASLAAIISYFSAEITRGIWKQVSMNGIEWPSPAANLTSVESEMREILAAAGVNVPSFLTGVSPAMLPLPMAALVSLTITFKLDKRLEYIHAVAGPALENCALGCSWPSMPIIGSLWAQKVRRWHDFIVVSCSRSVFRQNQEAVAQLMRSCFASFLGSLHVSASPMTSQNGVNGLLGSFISAPGLQPRVAPGFLYLRSCRTMHHVQHVNHVIVELVANSSRELAARWVSTDSPRLKSTQASLAVAIARAKEVATLGASLLCVAGGLQLVQELYQETIPTWLLSAREEKHGNQANAVSRILEGYSMAYLLVLSGALIWGVSAKPSLGSRRLRGVGNPHGLCGGGVGGFAPVWIREVKQETLRKLANGLRGWHECELALSLLERGGVAAMGSAAELVNVI
ncbi:REF4-related 1 [Actinidia rufa]|uniref:REF4-related 1 n=1 Tax=Actinidia rufa TaxID=165716 RepID=A0A7J0E7U5_9ERIC|nr:REF4-related 1 [Actinidia rufa]